MLGVSLRAVQDHDDLHCPASESSPKLRHTPALSLVVPTSLAWKLEEVDRGVVMKVYVA